MNKKDLEHLLPLARPLGRSGQQTSFTQSVMEQLRPSATFAGLLRTKNATKQGAFMKLLHMHKVAALAVAAVTTSIIGLTGYGYASGNNPFSVIKSWVTGDSVHVSYEGQTYHYGKNMNYSDAAITAYAELNTVQKLYSADNVLLTVPKGGIEYVDDPANTAPMYPWVGTVKQVTNDSLIVQKQFVIGDLASQNQDTDETITLPLGELSSSVEGKAVVMPNSAVGKVVEIYSVAYVKHRVNSTDPLQHVTHYFAYQLTHSLADIKEASKQPLHYSDPSAQPILPDKAPSTDTNLCYNNGADTCKFPASFNATTFQGLYGDMTDPTTGEFEGSRSNPSVVGVGDPNGTGPSKTSVVRQTEGAITAITDRNFTIKTSSGANWTFAYSSALQQTFAQTHSPLKIGDNVFAVILAPLTNLDNHTIDTAHIYQMARYKQ